MKKWIIPLLIFTFVFSFNCTAFAMGESWYSDATSYIQIDDDTRIVGIYSTSVSNTPIYIRDNGSSITFIHKGGTFSSFYLAHKDGTYSSFHGDSSVTETYGSVCKEFTFDFPLTIDGKTYSNANEFKIGTSGSNVYRVNSSSTLDGSPNFFLNLLETVELLQEGTTTAPMIVKDSYLVYLVPCGIGLLVLLTSLPTLKKVLFRFLPL